MDTVPVFLIPVLGEVADERHKQDAKWGAQNHPSVPDDRMRYFQLLTPCAALGIPEEELAKATCESNMSNMRLTWAHIAVEELSEAVSATDETARRAELVQLAAVIVAWIECIDRRASA